MPSNATATALALALLLGCVHGQMTSAYSIPQGSASASSAPASSSSQPSASQPASEAAPAAEVAPAAPLPTCALTLDSFSAVDFCAPINLLILPNTTGGYAATIQSETPVMRAINTTVTNGRLQITAGGPFNTTRPVQLTVSLPADALAELNHFGPGKFLVGKGGGTHFLVACV